MADEVLYDIYRAACVKEFELVLKQSGKLLRKRLAAYFATNRQADRLNFKDLFRHAARHELIDAGVEVIERGNARVIERGCGGSSSGGQQHPHWHRA